jgi:hypothetical protein
MPNDLSVSAVTQVNLGNDAVVPSKPMPTAAPVEQAAPTPFPSLNPSLQLDSALGIVVLEFRNSSGTITSSIPSQQQLAAYRQWQEVHVGPDPQLGASGGSGVSSPVTAATSAASVTPQPAPTLAPSETLGLIQTLAPALAPALAPIHAMAETQSPATAPPATASQTLAATDIRGGGSLG